MFPSELEELKGSGLTVTPHGTGEVARDLCLWSSTLGSSLLVMREGPIAQKLRQAMQLRRVAVVNTSKLFKVFELLTDDSCQFEAIEVSLRVTTGLTRWPWHCAGRGEPVLMHRDPPTSHQSGARSGLAGTELGRGRGPSAFKSALADELLRDRHREREKNSLTWKALGKAWKGDERRKSV